MSEFAVVIPARYASQRLPGKPLASLGGKPLIQHVWERARESAANEVIIATDDARIADAAEGFGASVCMTAATHSSGTERIAEVADICDWDDSAVVVNLQGDEPFMPAGLIAQCAALLDDRESDMATLASPFRSAADHASPDIVKALVDGDGRALFFSRAPVPFSRDTDTDALAWRAALQHHGIYAYRCGVLRQLVAAPASEFERCERLEQLRALHLGLRLRVGVPTERPGPGIDTPADLAAAERRLQQAGSAS